ncbi:unnamed protein product, partial [Arabidopsis halleri]
QRLNFLSSWSKTLKGRKIPRRLFSGERVFGKSSSPVRPLFFFVAGFCVFVDSSSPASRPLFFIDDGFCVFVELYSPANPHLRRCKSLRGDIYAKKAILVLNARETLQWSLQI